MKHQNCGLCQSKVATACGLAAASEGLRMHCIIIHIPMNLSQGVSLLLARAPVLWTEASSSIPTRLLTVSNYSTDLWSNFIQSKKIWHTDLLPQPSFLAKWKCFIRQDKLCSIGFHIKPSSCLHLHMKFKWLVIQICIGGSVRLKSGIFLSCLQKS